MAISDPSCFNDRCREADDVHKGVPHGLRGSEQRTMRYSTEEASQNRRDTIQRHTEAHRRSEAQRLTVPKRTKTLLVDENQTSCPLLAGCLPELEEGPRDNWGCLRRFCAAILETTSDGETPVFDLVISVFIIANIAIMVAEVDKTSLCELDPETLCVPFWISVLNNVFVAVYTAEALIRLQVHRFRVILQPWTMFDLIIVFCAWYEYAAQDMGSGVQMFRIARVARIVRMGKILSKFPTLQNMVRGFGGAMYAMLWGGVVILILIILWAILAVELFHPISQSIWAETPNDYCAMAFSTVWRATLLFFQALIAGDSWGACSIPIINHAPATFGIFALALVTIQLGFTNLVLAIIVDRAQEARELDKESRVKQKRRETERNLCMWATIADNLDSDGSGTLSKDEFMASRDDECLEGMWAMMDIDQEELKSLFAFLDLGNDGTITLQQVVNAFSKTHQDLRIYLMMVKLQLAKVHVEMSRGFQKLEQIMEQQARADAIDRRSSDVPSSDVPAKESTWAWADSGWDYLDGRFRQQRQSDSMDTFSRSLQARLDDLAAEAMEIRQEAAGLLAAEVSQAAQNWASGHPVLPTEAQESELPCAVEASKWACSLAPPDQPDVWSQPMLDVGELRAAHHISRV